MNIHDGVSDGLSTPPSSTDDDNSYSDTNTNSNLSSVAQLRISSEDITAELDSHYQELQNDLHIAGCVSRTKTRMELILVSSLGGKCSISQKDEMFCTTFLPLIVHIVFQRKTFPSSFTATNCNQFFQQVIKFCTKMKNIGDTMFELGLLLMGGQVEQPPYLSTKNVMKSSETTTNNAYNLAPFYTLGYPTSRYVGNEVVRYWGNDLTPVQRVADTYIGRDFKKKFRRYMSNGTGGWFSGTIVGYNINTK